MSFEQRRQRFGEQLRRLRVDAGLTGQQLADQLGWTTKSKVSRIERGRQSVSDEDLEQWLATLTVPADTADQLRAELAELRKLYVTWKQAMRRGHRAVQQEWMERESRARLIRVVDVGIVPGLVQTADYARHALLAHANLHGGGDDIADAVRTRMRRQQVLYEADRTIELLMTESALLHPVAPDDVMTGQIHRLMATLGVPGVRFGILPVGRRLPYMLMHGYWIINGLVQLETVSAELTVVDPDEVAVYNELTDMLWRAADENDDARALLVAALERFRADQRR